MNSGRPGRARIAVVDVVGRDDEMRARRSTLRRCPRLERVDEVGHFIRAAIPTASTIDCARECVRLITSRPRRLRALGGASRASPSCRRRSRRPIVPRRSPTCVRANWTAAVAIETDWPPMSVCVRASLPALIASRKSECSVLPSERACWPWMYASLTCARISASPISIESRPGADAQEMIDRLAPQQRVDVRVHVLDAAVAEIAEELPDLLDACFVIFEFGVDLEAAARLQHQRLFHRFVIAQRDQRFAHLVGRKRMALANVDRRGVVGQSHADERHGLPASRCGGKYRRQRVISHFQGSVDVERAMRGGQEPGLELRGREVHAAVEHGVEEAAVERGVGALGVAEVVHRAVGEEEPDHRAAAGRRVGARRGGRRPRTYRVQNAVRAPRDAGRPRDSAIRASVARPAAMASGLPESVPASVDRPDRREPVHDLGFAAERPDREPAADDLAQGREVGYDALDALDPPGATRKPVITSSKIRSAPSVGDLAQPVQETRERQHESHVADVRLDDERGDRAAVPFEGRAHGVESLYGTTIVSVAMPAVMPGESGTPFVNAPLPAEIRNASP